MLDPIDSFHFVAIVEGQLATGHQLIGYNSQRPHIYQLIVSAGKHFWCFVE